jgi:hypothetical protein
LHCSASIQTHFFDDSAYCRRKTEVMFATDHPLHSALEAMGASCRNFPRLSECELADIGIARCDIDRIARGQFRQ